MSTIRRGEVIRSRISAWLLGECCILRAPLGRFEDKRRNTHSMEQSSLLTKRKSPLGRHRWLAENHAETKTEEMAYMLEQVDFSRPLCKHVVHKKNFASENASSKPNMSKKQRTRDPGNTNEKLHMNLACVLSNDIGSLENLTWMWIAMPGYKGQERWRIVQEVGRCSFSIGNE